MKLPFYVDIRPSHSGVTGSCFHLKVVFPDRQTYCCIVDCGTFQGKWEATLNDTPLFPFLKNANSVILTHNHVDHIGRIPELVRRGYRGKIYTSVQNSGLLDKAWRDCEKIERINAGKAKRHPRYKAQHVTEALRMVEPLEYRQKFQIHPNIEITMFENGHTFGSSTVLMEIKAGISGYNPINFLFTGDYNSENRFFTVQEIPPEVREMPLHIICEATYGEASRQSDRHAVFEKNILEQVKLGKEILIPTFAFERGQYVLSILKRLQDEGKLSLSIPIYLEGKLLREYTNHYISVADEYFDKLPGEDILPANSSWITTPSQRDNILGNGDPKIIVASGGMMSFGPSQSYIPHIVPNPNAVIHFTGYQCDGTIGGRLKAASENGEVLELRGKLMKVECSVFYTEEFSAHALPATMLKFLSKFENRRSVILNHGTQEAKQDFAKQIMSEKLAKEVGIMSRCNSYRFTPYKLEKVTRVVEKCV